MTETARRVVVCRKSDLKVGKLTPATFGRAKIIVTQLPDGGIRAFPARCPHQGADLGAGCIVGLVQSERLNTFRVAPDELVVRCPWHGFEYDLRTGAPTVTPPEHRNLRIRLLTVELDGDDVVVVN